MWTRIMRRKFLSRRKSLFLLCALMLLVWFSMMWYKKAPTKDMLLIYNMISSSSNNWTGYNMTSPGCVHPKLELWNRNYAKIFYNIPPKLCSTSKDWVHVENGTFHIGEDILKKYKSVNCSYSRLKRIDDHKTKIAEKTNILHSEIRKTFIMKDDFYKVECFHEKSGDKYSNVHAGIHYNNNIHQRLQANEDRPKFNVLMIGFDSLSRMTYMRKLQKTYNYFTKNLNGVVLKGYNILGDGTPQALIPILTGKTELELPNTLKRIANSNYVDVYPMIWKDFQKKGYVTAWSEDSPYIATFTYRMRGFKKTPVDHYMRPFYVWSVDNNEYGKNKPLCLGDKRRSRVFLDWLRDVFIQYPDKPKWVFGFHCEISHDDNNLVQTADEDIMETLKFMEDNGYLNNTILILMSDHGARFESIRETLQGKQEERRPFFGIRVPKKFKELYPLSYTNLVTNSKRLTSPFDIHPTFKDILGSEFSGGMGNLSDRSISLFQEVPIERTCESAGIEAHWCGCLDWKTVSAADINVKHATIVVIDHINSLTSNQRKLCAKLQLNSITLASVLVPKTAMLQFKKSSDLDGYKADLSGSTSLIYVTYQIQFSTSPGKGHFEVTVKCEISTNKCIVTTGDISRTNRYGSDSKCIYDTHDNLRKFCYCVS